MLLIAVLVLSASVPQDAYKRVHQTALRHVLEGRIEAADEQLTRFVEREREDAETAFLRALVRCAAGDARGAQEAAQRALLLGLPPERLLAGPREWVEPLSHTDWLKKQSAPFASRPLHGPLLGAIEATRATLWLRTAQPAEVTVYAGELGRERRPVGVGRTTAAHDYTTVVTLEGLEADRLYSYAIALDDHPPVTAAHYRFRTAPEAGQSDRFTLAFGGGAGYVPEHERMWTTIERQNPRLLLLLGDNVYSDAPELSAMQRYCYYRRQSRPEFRHLTGHTPTLTIWDDHDFGTNDCFGGPEIDEPPWKRAVWDVYRQNWANPSYGGGAERPGCWYSFVFGDVEFFMLDGRYYRTDPKSEDPSMLGPQQKAWLLHALGESEATFKLLCSPVPWNFHSKGDSLDTWNGYRNERAEIFDFLAETAVEGVVLLSADRHRSDAWKIEREGAYALYEFNSSRLTNQHLHPVMQQALFSYNEKPSFGLVTIDTTLEDPSVSYAVISIDGDTVHELTLRLSQLR